VISKPLAAAFRDAVVRSLPPGEVLSDVSECYTEEWAQVYSEFLKAWQPTFQGFAWMAIALTNLNVRLITWQQQQVKTGLLSRTNQTIPAVQSNTAFALSQITSVGVSQFTPRKPPNKALTRIFGTDVGGVSSLNVQGPGGGFDVGSPFTEFFHLTQQLEAMRSGTLRAQQSGSVADAVERLAGLREDGLLSDDEFDRAKAGFVGIPVEVAESSASLIRQIYSLYQSGVLSESEFNMKKWDILSRKG